MSQYLLQLLGNFVFLTIQKLNRIKFKPETEKSVNILEKAEGRREGTRTLCFQCQSQRHIFPVLPRHSKKIFLNKKALIFHPIKCWKTAFQYYLQALMQKRNKTSHIPWDWRSGKSNKWILQMSKFKIKTKGKFLTVRKVLV